MPGGVSNQHTFAFFSGTPPGRPLRKERRGIFPTSYSVTLALVVPRTPHRRTQAQKPERSGTNQAGARWPQRSPQPEGSTGSPPKPSYILQMRLAATFSGPISANAAEPPDLPGKERRDRFLGRMHTDDSFRSDFPLPGNFGVQLIRTRCEIRIARRKLRQ